MKRKKHVRNGCEWRAFGCKEKWGSPRWKACEQPIVNGTKICQRHREHLHGLKDRYEGVNSVPTKSRAAVPDGACAKAGGIICEVLREMRPTALAIVPLYRGAIAILPDPEMVGNAILKFYGDPMVMGEGFTPEALEKYCTEMHVAGNRWGPQLKMNGKPLN